MKLQKRGKTHQKGDLQKTSSIEKEERKALVMKERGAFTPSHNHVNYDIKKYIVRVFLILGESSIPFLSNVPAVFLILGLILGVGSTPIRTQ